MGHDVFIGASFASCRATSFRANTVNPRSVYVAISTARSSAALYTDSRARLTDALGIRDGAQVGAIDQIMARQKEGAAIGL